MKRSEKQKLRELTKAELKIKVEAAKKERASLSMQKASGKLKDLHTYAKKRKEIAAFETILKEKELTK